MLYVAAELYMPSGEKLRNHVVETEMGRVRNIYRFVGEVHSMVFLSEVYLFCSLDVKTISSLQKGGSGSCEGNPLYAYRLDDAGRLVILE